ncbi:MAG: DNA gyrase inhibitor YacG [Phycisphaerae bacterium]|nr:DNA gyrase inhibitor YacG [Phycisphaerae bacterium]
MKQTASAPASAQTGATALITFECPTCRRRFSVGRREEAAFRPFCSYRCKMVDLGRWLDGTYAVTEPLSPDDPRQDSGEDESQRGDS